MKRATSASKEAAQNIRRLIQSAPALESPLRGNRPDWALNVKGLHLSEASACELIKALKRIWVLPFADVPLITDLVLFQFTRLPSIRSRFARLKQSENERLCQLFDLMVLMSLQGFSLFPQNPAHLAQQIQKSLESPGDHPGPLLPLLRLLINQNNGQPDTGLNSAKAADPEFWKIPNSKRTGG
jgi:hypothetical protein